MLSMSLYSESESAAGRNVVKFVDDESLALSGVPVGQTGSVLPSGTGHLLYRPNDGTGLAYNIIFYLS